jgi:hypothetical protein
MEIPLKLCIPCSRQDVAVLEGAYQKSEVTIDLTLKSKFFSLSFKPGRPLKERWVEKRGANQTHVKKRRET